MSTYDEEEREWSKLSGKHGASYTAEVGIPSQRHNKFLAGISVVVPGPAVIATDLITLGSAVNFEAGDAVILSGTDFTEATSQSLDGVQLVLTADDTTHMTLDDGSETVVDIDAVGTATGLAAFVKKQEFLQAEKVRRYRIKAELVSGGGFMKFVEDADNSLQAANWLQDQTVSGDVEYNRVEDSAGLLDGWTEWQELSKNPADDSLSNLYFAGSNTAGVWNIFIEAE